MTADNISRRVHYPRFPKGIGNALSTFFVLLLSLSACLPDVRIESPIPPTEKSTVVPTLATQPLRTPMPYPPRPASPPANGIGLAQNVLQNPGFEDDFNGWWYGGDPAGVTTEIDTTLAHSGTKSLRIRFDGSENVDYYQVGQDVPVGPETTYLLQAYMRVDGVRAYGGVSLLVQDARGWDYLGYSTPDMYTTQDWTRVSTIAFTTPSETSALTIMVARSNRDWNSPISGTVWLDDVSLLRLPPQISPASLTLLAGQAQTVAAISGATAVTWTSSNPAVATVEKSNTRQAQVRAISAGDANITVTDNDGEMGVLALKVIDQSTIIVNAGNVLRPVPEAMFGNNLDYVNGFPWTVWGDASPAYIADVAELGMTSLRFPGGTEANSYDFSLGKGWIDWTGASQQYNMTGYTTDDFIQFLRETGIPGAMITANVYKSGNKDWPEDNWISCQVAADWVNYTNRVLDYYVGYWELGNEIFYNGEIPWGEPQVPGLTQALYLQKIHDCSSAMKAVDSKIKIGASLQLPEGQGGAEEWWDLPILQTRSDDLDFLVVHPYILAEDGYLEAGRIMDSTATNIFSRIWATHPIINLRQWIDTYAPARADSIEIQASEWSVYMHDVLTDGYDTLLNAVLNTDFFWDMVLEGADGANIWDLYMTLGPEGEEVYKFAQYYMLWMNRHRSGKWLVESPVTSPTYSGNPYGSDEYALMKFGTVDGVPYLSAYATLSEDGSRLYLIVTNKSADGQTTTIHLNGFTPQSQASVWQMTSANWSDTGLIPATSTIQNAASGLTYTFPARSVTSFVFEVQPR
jgi:alpha-L-arabinofuranosidase